MSIGTRCHPAAVANGKSAPDSSHSGISTRLTMAWKPCVDSKCHANTKPRPVTQNASSPSETRATTTPEGVSDRPASGASASSTTACPTASVVPPSSRLTTIAERGAGEARTPCRKPASRSVITEMAEKIAVNTTISASVPGKKYAR